MALLFPSHLLRVICIIEPGFYGLYIKIQGIIDSVVPSSAFQTALMMIKSDGTANKIFAVL